MWGGLYKSLFNKICNSLNSYEMPDFIHIMYDSCVVFFKIQSTFVHSIPDRSSVPRICSVPHQHWTEKSCRILLSSCRRQRGTVSEGSRNPFHMILIQGLQLNLWQRGYLRFVLKTFLLQSSVFDVNCTSVFMLGMQLQNHTNHVNHVTFRNLKLQT